MRDIVHIQVGQCGNQISSKVLMHTLFLKHADQSCIRVCKKTDRNIAGFLNFILDNKKFYTNLISLLPKLRLIFV